MFSVLGHLTRTSRSFFRLTVPIQSTMAAKKTASGSAETNVKLKKVADAEIDPDGRFKYILIKVCDQKVDDDFKFIVRGTAKAGFHADIYEMVAGPIEKEGLDCEVMGGGRIEHHPSKKEIKIYGYSQGYGRADHTIGQAILQRKYPSYTITWSNDGY